jgi:hypothetical protein
MITNKIKTVLFASGLAALVSCASPHQAVYGPPDSDYGRYPEYAKSIALFKMREIAQDICSNSHHYGQCIDIIITDESFTYNERYVSEVIPCYTIGCIPQQQWKVRKTELSWSDILEIETAGHYYPQLFSAGKTLKTIVSFSFFGPNYSRDSRKIYFWDEQQAENFANAMKRFKLELKKE